MQAFRPIILALAIAGNAHHVFCFDESSSSSPPVLDELIDAVTVDIQRDPNQHKLTGLRLSDFSDGGIRGMGRRLFSSLSDDDDDSLDAIEGIDNLQRDFFNVHGRNFTEEELNDALDDAYVRATANDGANLRFDFDEDLLLDLERGRALRAASSTSTTDQDTEEEENARELGKKQQSQLDPFPPTGNIIRGGTGMLVSLESPGFPGNPGRRSGIHGLYWCASLRETRRADIETPLNQRLTLKNCKLADIRQIEWSYTGDLELLVSRVGTFFHEFCARTKDGRQGRMREKIRMNQCGTNINNTQSWELYTNYQWRSAENEGLCVATKRARKRGGGTLRLRTCVGPDLVDMFNAGQLWTLCRTEGTCAVGTGSFDRRLPLRCDISQNCRPSGRRGQIGRRREREVDEDIKKEEDI